MFLNRMNRKKNSQKRKKLVIKTESKKEPIKDSNGSEDDDNHVSNHVGFQVITKKLVDTITIDVATTKMTASISIILQSVKNQIQKFVKILI